MHKIKLVILCMFIMTASMTACSSEKKNITELQKESTEKSEGTIEQTNTATLNVSTETIPHTEEVTTDTVSERDYSADGISWKEAETLITEVLGTEDKRTGYSYSFSYIDTCEVDDTIYHVFQWSWLVRDHMSTRTQLFVSTDGKMIYEGMYNGDKNIVYTEKNYIE